MRRLLLLVLAAGAAARLDAQPPQAWSVETPTGPTKSLAFEATQGTWMSLSVSPDGRFLAFDLLGAIYEMPIEGGVAKRLTSGRSWNLFPRYSPDGRSIAFSSDRSGSHNIWVMDRQGGSLQHLPAPEELVYRPAWSNDGRRVYGTTSGDGFVPSISAFGVNGGRQVLVKGGALATPVALPGGSLVFYERAGRDVYPFGFNPYVIPLGGTRIESYDEQTGETRIELERPGGAFAPAPSPNGKLLAYLNREGEQTVLVLHDRLTRRERVLLRGLDHDRQEAFGDYGPYSSLAWHPDGRRLYLGTGGAITAVDVETGAASKIAFRAPVERELSHTIRFKATEPRDRAATRFHRWGQRTGRGVLSEALGDLWLDDGRGGRTNLTNSPLSETSPVVDPKTGTLYFAGWSDADLGAVYRLPPNGTAERLTTVPAQYGSIAVAPAGGRIAYVRGSGGVERGLWLSNEVRFDLMVREANGQERRVTGIDGQALEYANIAGKIPPGVTFSPDGETVYFTEFDHDTLTLKRVPVSGGRETSLLRFPHGVAAAVSPDLRWVAYREYQRSYLTALTESGQPALVSAQDRLGASARIDPEDGGYLTWSADGATISWTRGAGYYEKAVDQVLAEAITPRRSAPPSEWSGARVPGSTAKRQDLAVEYSIDKNPTPIVLTGARVLTMNGRREVLENGTIVVENGQIKALGRGVSIPAGARRYNLGGMTIIPGMVDAHAHPHIEHSSLHVIEQQPTYLSGPLAYGVTTVFEVYGNEYRDAWLSDMLRAGKMTGPRFFTTGSTIFGERRGYRLRMFRPIVTLDDALEQLRWNKDNGATAVKDYLQPTRIRRHLTATAARALGLNMVSESNADPQMNLTQLLDGGTGIEHSMGLMPFYEDVVKFWGGTAAGMTPTLLVVYNGKMGEGWYHQGSKLWEDPKLTKFITPEHLMRVRNPTHLWPEDMAAWRMATEIKKLAANGTSLQVGAHGQMFGLDYHWELGLLAKGGFTPTEVLEMATIKGAAYHGLDDQLGSVEVGKLADLVVLEADPRSDITNVQKIRYVMKNGVLYAGADAARVWPNPAPQPKPYFAARP